MYAYPNELGRYGEFGGKFVPETLMRPLKEIEQAFNELKEDRAFKQEYLSLLQNYSGRPTALTYADQLSAYLGGAKIYLKREDLNHTGAHKINNALGQALLAKKMGKSNIIAETGAGQHGVAVQRWPPSLDYRARYLWEKRMWRDNLSMYSE